MGTLSIKARFVPQAWINDNTVDVDPEGETTWDASEAFSKLSAVQQQTLLKDQDPEGGEILDTDDLLKGDPAAPLWIKEWKGPFSIWITVLSAFPKPTAWDCDRCWGSGTITYTANMDNPQTCPECDGSGKQSV